MDIQEMRSLTNDQLTEELGKTYRELMNLRFRAATNQLVDTNQPKKTRKDIARLLTVLRERNITVN